MVMDSALVKEANKAKCNYLKFWLSEETSIDPEMGGYRKAEV